MQVNYTSTKRGPGRLHRSGTKKAGRWLNHGILPREDLITTITQTSIKRKDK
jgi:hypothetical protein